MSSRVARSSISFPSTPAPGTHTRSSSCADTSPSTKSTKRVSFAATLESPPPSIRSQPAHRTSVDVPPTTPARHSVDASALLRPPRTRAGSAASVSSVETIRAATVPSKSSRTLAPPVISRPRPLSSAPPKPKPGHARSASAAAATTLRAAEHEQSVAELLGEQLKRKRADSGASTHSALFIGRDTLADELARAVAPTGGPADGEKHRTVHLTKKSRRGVFETFFRAARGGEREAAPAAVGGTGTVKVKEGEKRTSAMDVFRSIQAEAPASRTPKPAPTVPAARAEVPARTPVFTKPKPQLITPSAAGLDPSSKAPKPSKPTMKLPSFPALPAAAPQWKPIAPEHATPTDERAPAFALSIVGAHTDFWDGEQGDTVAYRGYLHLRELPSPSTPLHKRAIRIEDAPAVTTAEVRCYVSPERRRSLALPGAVGPDDVDTSFYARTRLPHEAHAPEDIVLSSHWELAYPSSRSAAPSGDNTERARAARRATAQPIGWKRSFVVPLPVALFGGGATRQFTLRAALTLAVELGIGADAGDWGELVRVRVADEARVTVGRVSSARDIAPGFVEIDGEKRRREQAGRVQRARYEAAMARMVEEGEVF